MHSGVSKASERRTVDDLLKACGADTSEVAVGRVMPGPPCISVLAQ